MTVALTALPLVLGGSVTVDLANDVPAQGVILANLSGFAVRVGQTATAWLAPWTADVFRVPTSASSLEATAVEVLNAAGVSPVLLPTLITTSDSIPAGYPCSLSADEIVAAISEVEGDVSVLSDQQSVAVGQLNGLGQTVNITLPLWCRRVVVLATVVSTDMFISGMTLTGLTTGFESINYSNQVNTLTSVLIAGSLYGSLELAGATLGITISDRSGPAIGGVNYWVVALDEDSPIGGPANPQNEQVTAWQYGDQVVDGTFANSSSTAGTLTLLAAPPVGYVYKVTNWAYELNAAAATFQVGGSTIKRGTAQTGTITDGQVVVEPITVSSALTVSWTGTSIFSNGTYKLIPASIR